MITKRYKLYKNFGKCMEISNGTVKALVTVDIGPRVIYYGVKGMNIMHEDIDRLTNKGGEFFDKNFKEGEKWYLYGGHRIWIPGTEKIIGSVRNVKLSECHGFYFTGEIAD